MSDALPIVKCPGCRIDMVPLAVEQKPGERLDSVTYRCPKCGTETTRQYILPSDELK